MRGFVEEIERQKYNEIDPEVENMEKISDLLDNMRGEILQGCRRKLMSGGIDLEAYKPGSHQVAQAILCVVLREKGQFMLDLLPDKTKRDARNLMHF